jgi:hypothetical protein
MDIEKMKGYCWLNDRQKFCLFNHSFGSTQQMIMFILLLVAIAACHRQPEPVPRQIILNDSSQVDINPVFEKILVEKKVIDNEMIDGRIRYGKIRYIDTLHIPGSIFEYSELRSLKGIEYFLDLKYLNIAGSYLDSLDLSKNIKLVYLDCRGLEAGGAGLTRTIKQLDVSKCVDLKFLDCSNNLLKTINISGNTKLGEVNCSNNDLAQLDISKNTLLTYLNTSFNRELTSLNIQATPLLKKLLCAYNAFPSLDVRHLSQLQHLDCSFHRYEGKTTFMTLDVSGNQKLEFLDISGSKLTQIDLSMNPELQSLNISLTQGLGAVDLSHSKKLRFFGSAHSNLTKLDLENNNELEGLGISGTKLEAIDLSPVPKLKMLLCYQQDHISALDLRVCPDLEIALTFQCPRLSQICVNSIPEPSNRQWVTSEWTHYSKCK